MEAEISLNSLFSRALRTASRASALSTIEDATQELIQSALADLRRCSSRIAQLHLFSTNEQLADIPTRDLVYILVPYALSEVLSSVRTVDPAERLSVVNDVKSHLDAFIRSLSLYGVITQEDKAFYERPASSITDPAKRRDMKIKQYKREKDMKARIEQSLSKRTTHNPVDFNLESTYHIIVSLLPDASLQASKPESDDDDDNEDVLREAVILVLRYVYIDAQSKLESNNQELELLRTASLALPRQTPTDDPRVAKKRADEDMWRLDAPVNQDGPDGKGPLLDDQGRPLRTFTILPSSTTERARLQAQVFQPDHRLPSMTIDEYLEIERQRGNIITGGGPQSESKPTSKEQLAIDAEQDGTVFGGEKAEDKRQQDESWAQYTDTHRKGSGNTMNRG